MNDRKECELVRGHKLLLAATLAAALSVSACGDGATTGSSPAGGSSAATPTGSGVSAQTRAAIDAAYTGSYGASPDTSPRPEPGMNIWLVTLSATYGAPQELVDAAKLMGWDVTVFDGQYTPDVVIDGLRQAVADKADGVIVGYADCASIKAGLQDVRDAGIPIVNIDSSDCDKNIGPDGEITDSGQPTLFDSGIGYHNPDNHASPLTFAEFWQLFNSYQALGIVGGTQGQAKLIVMSESDLLLNFVGIRELKATLEEHCPGCEIVDIVDFVGTDFGTGIQQKVA